MKATDKSLLWLGIHNSTTVPCRHECLTVVSGLPRETVSNTCTRTLRGLPREGLEVLGFRSLPETRCGVIPRHLMNKHSRLDFLRQRHSHQRLGFLARD